MRWHPPSLIAASFILLLGASAFGQQGPPSPNNAGGFLRVVTDPDAGLGEIIADEAWGSIFFTADRAATEVVGKPVDAKVVHATVYPASNTRQSPGVVLLYVGVQSHDEKIAAQAVLAKMVELFRHRVEMLDQQQQLPDRERLKVLDQLVDRAFVEMMEAKRSLEINAALHKVPVDAKAAAERQGQLSSTVATLETEIKNLQAQEAVYREQYAELANQQKSADVQDPVTAELVKANNFRRQAVQVARESLNDQAATKKELVSRKQVLLAAEAEYAEREAQLAKERRESSQGARLEAIRRKLDEVKLDAELAKGKLSVAMGELSTGTSDMELARLKAERLEADYRAIAAERDQLDRKLRLHRKPSVVLIDPLALPDSAAGKAPEKPSPPDEKPK